MQNKDDPWNFSVDADSIVIVVSFEELRVVIWLELVWIGPPLILLQY